MREKLEFRKKLLQKRRLIQDKSHKDSEIFAKLIALPEFAKAKLVLTYYSMELEVNTHGIIKHCLNENIPLAVPGILNGKMQFFRLLQPLDIDTESIYDFTDSVCFVPGLAYDRNNRRLGYGGGYYDKFLQNYPGVKIGLCYDEFIMDIPVENHDEKVALLITNSFARKSTCSENLNRL